MAFFEWSFLFALFANTKNTEQHYHGFLILFILFYTTFCLEIDTELVSNEFCLLYYLKKDSIFLNINILYQITKNLSIPFFLFF